MQDFRYLCNLKLECATLLATQTKANAKKEHKAGLNALSTKNKTARIETRKRMIDQVEAEKKKCIDWYNTVKIDADLNAAPTGRQTRRRVQRGDEEGDRAAKDDSDLAELAEKAKKAVPIFRLDLVASEIEGDMRALNAAKPAKPTKKREQKEVVVQEYTKECYYEHLPIPEERVAYGDRLRYDGRWYYRFQKVTLETHGSVKVTGT